MPLSNNTMGRWLDGLIVMKVDNKEELSEMPNTKYKINLLHPFQCKYYSEVEKLIYFKFVIIREMSRSAWAYLTRILVQPTDRLDSN
jgi:hypothetical protein